MERLIRDAMRERDDLLQGSPERSRASWTSRQTAQSAPRSSLRKRFAWEQGQEFRWDKALAVADAIEDEELSRKLTLRK